MEGERQQIECDEQRGEVVLAVAETVFEIVATCLHDIERAVLDLPPRAASGGAFGGVLPIDRQVGDETVPVSDVTAGIGDLDLKPVDREGVLGVAERDSTDPAIPVADPGPTVFDAFRVALQHDAGDVFLNKRMRRGLADEQEVAPGGEAGPQYGLGGKQLV